MATLKHRDGKTDAELDVPPPLAPSGSSSSSNSSAPPRSKSPRSRFTPEYEVLLELLVAARKEAGVTQKEVAARIKKTQSHVSMCEAKEREFSFVDVFRFCEAIGWEFSLFAQRVEQEIRRRNI